MESLSGDELELQKEIVAGIIREAKEFNDVIVGDFLDTYENLPLKTYLGYQFFHDYCDGHQERCLKKQGRSTASNDGCLH